MDSRTTDDRSDMEKAGRRRKRLLWGILNIALAPVVFVLVVMGTMEEGDCIPGWGPCPTASGIALGAAAAAVLLGIAFVLLWHAVQDTD